MVWRIAVPAATDITALSPSYKLLQTTGYGVDCVWAQRYPSFQRESGFTAGVTRDLAAKLRRMYRRCMVLGTGANLLSAVPLLSPILAISVWWAKDDFQFCWNAVLLE
jgi:hypothetical protein